MNNEKTKTSFWAYFATFFALAIIILSISKALIFMPHLAVVLNILFVISIIAFLISTLKFSISKTIYSYKNIMLVGGIIFLSVLTIVSIYDFIIYYDKINSSLKSTYSLLLDFPFKFSVFAEFIIAAVSIALAVSNIALIHHEGFRPSNALSILIASLYIGGTQAIYKINKVLSKASFITPSNSNMIISILSVALSLFLLLMLCYFECILAGAAIMGWKAAHTVPCYDKDFIIILGCSISKSGGLLPLLKGRVNRAIRLAWEQEIATNKPMKYVPSGGQGSDEVMSEGSAMELYLLSHGAEDYEVFPEKKSTNTYENFRMSKAIIDSQVPDAKIAFATTNYHILRSGIIAQRAGIDAQGIAGDTKWYFWPNGFVREFFGILKLEARSHVYVAVATAVVSVIFGIMGWSFSLA